MKFKKNSRATVLHGVCLLAGSAAARARLQQVLATVKAQQSDAKDLPGSVPVEEFGSAETQAQVAATEMVCSSCGTVHEPGMHATARGLPAHLCTLARGPAAAR